MEWVKNPWVWGGGVALVLAYLLLGKSSSGGGSASYSQANLNLVAQQAQISGAIEQDQIAANTQNTATIAASIGNLLAAKYAYMLGSQQVSAGVRTAGIASDTAKYIEHDNNKVQMLSIMKAFKEHMFDGNVQLASQNIQAATAENIAGMQASAQKQKQTYGFFGDLFKGLTSIL